MLHLYANWAECDSSIERAAAQGVNVVMWFAVSLAFDSRGSPIVHGGPNLTCVGSVAARLEAQGLPTHLVGAATQLTAGCGPQELAVGQRAMQKVTQARSNRKIIQLSRVFIQEKEPRRTENGSNCLSQRFLKRSALCSLGFKQTEVGIDIVCSQPTTKSE